MGNKGETGIQPRGVRVEFVPTLEPYVGERIVIIDTRTPKAEGLSRAERTLTARQRRTIKNAHNLNKTV